MKQLMGEVFGKLKVVGRESRGRRVYWDCVCECGNKTQVMTASLTRDSGTRSCGCLRLAKMKHEIGNRYGRLTVVGLGERTDRQRWICQCDCGGSTVAEGFALRSGHTTSCGCYAREQASAKAKHGWARDNAPHHRLYHIWQSMRNRCQNSNFEDYHNYGGRGIRVDPLWDSFERFRQDMEPTWKKGLSLDRIDNNGPYAPGNCRWATRKEQMSNTRRNKRVTFQGETLTIKQWSEKLGVRNNMLDYRLKAGWPLEMALNAKKNVHYHPKGPRNKRK